MLNKSQSRLRSAAAATAAAVEESYATILAVKFDETHSRQSIDKKVLVEVAAFSLVNAGYYLDFRCAHKTGPVFILARLDGEPGLLTGVCLCVASCRTEG